MENIKRIIKTTWKHFVGSLVGLFLLLVLFEVLSVDMNMKTWEQTLLFTVIGFVVGYFIEIMQKTFGGKNSKMQMLEDAVMAALGAFVSVILFNLIF